MLERVQIQAALDAKIEEEFVPCSVTAEKG